MFAAAASRSGGVHGTATGCGIKWRRTMFLSSVPSKLGWSGVVSGLTSPFICVHCASPFQWANVAQLVEQLTRNEQVVGSIPTVGSISIVFSLHALRRRRSEMPPMSCLCPVSGEGHSAYCDPGGPSAFLRRRTVQTPRIAANVVIGSTRALASAIS